MLRGPYADAELVHVISAVVMPRSFPTNEVMTIIEPPRREPIAMAIVAVKTNRVSVRVDLKHAGRASGSIDMVTVESLAMFFSSTSARMPAGEILAVIIAYILIDSLLFLAKDRYEKKKRKKTIASRHMQRLQNN